MAKVNFLLGKAERLVRKIPAPPMKPDKAHPYEFSTAKDRIAPKFEVTAAELLKRNRSHPGGVFLTN